MIPYERIIPALTVLEFINSPDRYEHQVADQKECGEQEGKPEKAQVAERIDEPDGNIIDHLPGVEE